MFEATMYLGKDDSDIITMEWGDWEADMIADTIVTKEIVKTLFGDNKDNNSEELDFEDIIINPPATIVKWDDGTKTVVKCQNGDVYDAEKGIALCFMKKMFDNKSYYNEVIKEAIAKNEARQNKK